MTISTDRNQQLQQLQDLITDIDCAMLTSIDDDGSLHSRPMYFNGDIDADGTIWFFTSASSHKAWEIEQRQQINVNFSSVSSQHQVFVSISSTAALITDRKTIEQRWEPELTTWFPQGLDTPDIAVLKVNINRVDYWDGLSNFQAKTLNF